VDLLYLFEKANGQKVKRHAEQNQQGDQAS
jgi:hypothetical protein